MGLTVLDLTEAKTAIIRAREAFQPELFSLTSNLDPEDARFKRITAPNTLRDLNPLMHERHQQIAYFLRATTPFGKRIVEVITSYVVGEGFAPVAKDEKVLALLKSFWKDPINRMDQALRDWTDEKTTFGELCLPVAVNPVNGAVRLGYIDPQRIEAIEYGDMQTSDGTTTVSIPVAVRLRRTAYESEGARLRIIRREENVNSPDYGRMTGDCFFFAINKAKSASRGLSELFTLADWIDVFDQMMFDYADKIRMLNAFVWHYTLKGADEKKLEDYVKKLTKNPPRQGGVQVTNENVEIEARTPDFKGADMAEAARMIKLYGLGGAGLPAWFFADPMDSNRSTADEMTGPTGKKLTDRQNDIRANVIEILDFVVEKAIEKGVLPESVDREITLQVPDLMIKDLQKAATTLGALTNSLSVAEENGWIRGETAARSFHVALSQVGVEIEDSADEYKLAQQEKQDRLANDANALDVQQNLAAALKQLNSGQGAPAQ
jgi:hypothetical protein